MGGWEQAHRRYELVHAVAEEAGRLGGVALNRREAEIVAEYGDLATFLLDVQRRCHEAAFARLDLALEEGATARGVRRALTDATGAHGALWRLLRLFADHPALADGSDRFREAVLTATGIDPAPERSTQTV